MTLHQKVKDQAASRGNWLWSVILSCCALGCGRTVSQGDDTATVTNDPAAPQSSASESVSSPGPSSAASGLGAPGTSATASTTSAPVDPPLPPLGTSPAESVEPAPAIPPPSPPESSETLDAGVSSEVDAGAAEPDPDDGWGLDAMDDPIENPAECPTDEPTTGQPCTFGLTCKYGSEPDCRSRWLCSSQETWYMEYGKRGCPEVCPTEEPSEGDPCSEANAQCTFGESADCRSLWLCYEEQWYLIAPPLDCEAESACPETPPPSGLDCPLDEVGTACTYDTAELCRCLCYWDEAAMAAGEAAMQWLCGTTSAQLPPSYLTSCPADKPVHGAPCDSGSTCAYVTADECAAPGAGTTLVTCDEGAWNVQEPTPP